MNLKKWKIISIVFSLILGTFLHFAYELSGKNESVAIFSSVNESTWEHLKLVFFPMLFIAIIGYFLIGKESQNYIKANTRGILVAMAFITIFFYTYSGIIGENYGIINIASFVIAIIIGEECAYKIMLQDEENTSFKYLVIIAIVFICFVLFTYFPPKMGYFKDPINQSYGIEK